MRFLLPSRLARILLACVAAFVFVEVVVRVVRPHRDLWVWTGRAAGPNPLSEWAYADAFSAYRAKPAKHPNREDERKSKTVNRYGFISTPEMDRAKPAGTTRIVFLGGSSTAGTGHNLSDEDTWPWQTVERLNAATSGRQYDFINAALSGFTTFESYGRLWSRLRFFSPDLVVVNHAWNEMYYFGRVDEIEGWRVHSDGSWDVTTGPPLERMKPLWIDHLIWPSQVLTKVRLKLRPPRSGEVGSPPPEALADSFDRRALEIFRTNLRLIKNTTETIGAELLVVKQPTLVVDELEPRLQERCRYHFHGFDHAAHVDAFEAIYEVIEDEIPAPQVIDATGLSGAEDYFKDHIHPTELGAKAIADLMVRRILEFRTQPNPGEIFAE